MTRMNTTPISFKVPTKLWEAFKRQTDELFLKYSPFLDHMVSRELTYLSRDLADLSMTTKAKRHIAGCMKRMETTSVNIEVRPETADALRQAVQLHNLVRDAFMSRLIIFLRSSDDLLDNLEVPRKATGKVAVGSYLEAMPSSPLGAMEAVRDDPLFYVRAHVEANWGCGIYRVALSRRLDWAACYLPDEEVSGTSAHRRKKKEDAEFLKSLDEKEPSKPKRSIGSRK